MQLVIAEKPSVARDLARVLGVRSTGRNLLEGPERVITWCIGHLVELEEPAAYDPRWKAWRLDTLPMVPSAFKLRPVSGTRDQLRVVCDLLRQRRFSEVVNACDAGREGELIFRYVYELGGSRLPVRRLWISSLTDEAIRQGFATLRPAAEYDPLGDAARCRSEADWLVGMNATRAVTLGFRAREGSSLAIAAPTPQPKAPVTGPGRWTRGGKSANRGRTGNKGPPAGKGYPGRSPLPAVYSIGRVQTPTLAIVVRREQEIRAFQPRDYWEVRGTFVPATDAAQNNFTALWTTKRPGDKSAVTRFGLRDVAERVVARTTACGAAGKPAGPVVEALTQKRSREPPPQLFDLTSLQRTANRRYGFSATRTLETAQALYERHKVLSYPRTDSRHLPHDQAAELPKLFRGLAKIPAYAPFAEPLLQSDPTPAARSRRIFDDAKVHDHHAIIPTGKVPGQGALGPDEQRIFDLVARRFLGVFHPDAEFALTEAVVRVGDAAPVTGTAPDSTTSVAAPRHSTAAASTTASASAPATVVAPDETMLAELPAPPDRFTARGRVRLVAGWQAVAGIDERRGAAPEAEGGGAADGSAKDVESTLPPLTKGQRLEGRFESIARQTRPPPRHTEATLLGAMESAGREIEDEALRTAMKDTGLGTPATRASTIETLVKRGFIAREGKQVIATPTGIGLIERLPVPTLASPELTGAWEARLVRIARGQETRSAFMTDIVRYVGEVTEAIRRGVRSDGPGVPRPETGAARPAPATTAGGGKATTAASTDIAPNRGTTGGSAAVAPGKGTTGASLDAARALPCPRCRQGTLMAGKRGWGCSRWREGCPFVIWFEIAGRRITDAQLRDLVGKGKTRKGKWAQPGEAPVTGHLVLEVNAAREAGGARFLASPAPV